MRFPTVTLLAGLVVACSPPSPQPEPNEMDTLPGTRVADAVPDNALASGADTAGGNKSGSDQGALQDVDGRTPADLVGTYAQLLDQGRFADAYGLWDPQSTTLSKDRFVDQFDKLATIDAAIGKMGRAEGAAGSIYGEVQLTLTGKTAGGKGYSLTGPVTVKRVNDVPGSTREQRRWRIVKMQLTSNPAKAETLIKG